MRVSAHPDHFTLLNSPDEGVVKASLADLAYHAGLLDAMGLGEDAKIRAQADFIDPAFFQSFVAAAGEYNHDFDVMLEAKQKDTALFRLMNDLRDVSGLRIVDPTTIEYSLN